MSKGAHVVQVMYPRTANNDKELTVLRGEYLEVKRVLCVVCGWFLSDFNIMLCLEMPLKSQLSKDLYETLLGAVHILSHASMRREGVRLV